MACFASDPAGVAETVRLLAGDLGGELDGVSQLLDRDVFGDAVLDVLEAGVVGVEHEQEAISGLAQ